MRTHSFTYFATSLVVVVSLSLFLSDNAQSDDCPTVGSHPATSRLAMGGDFDECNARLVGPDEVCTGFENPYFVVGEAKSCSKVGWLLTDQSPDEKDMQVWFEGWFGANFGKDTYTEKEDKHRLFVESSAEETPGKFDIKADANDCGCGTSSRSVKVLSDKTSPCEKIQDQALCRAWRRLQAITKIAEQLNTKNVTDIVDEAYRNEDGTYKTNRNKELAGSNLKSQIDA